MDKNRIFKEKGITLIALIVTIIVLLILAGVSIAVLTGQNGLLNRATEAKQTNEQKTAEEELKLGIAALSADYYSKTTRPATFREFVFSEDSKAKLNQELNGGAQFNNTNYTITYKNATYQVAENGALSIAEGLVLLDKLDLINGVDESYQLTAEQKNINAPSLSWTSSDTSVATVSNTGLVTVVGVGKTKITVSGTYNNKNYTAECNLTVANLTVELGENKDVVIGGSEILIPTITPASVASREDITINWTSSTTSVATIIPATGASTTVSVPSGVTAGATSIITVSIKKVGETDSLSSDTCTVKAITSPWIDKSYVNYNVEYTDVYTGTEYKSNTGWRLLTDLSSYETVGTFEGNIEIISTGIPAKLKYDWNSIKNFEKTTENGSIKKGFWAGDETDRTNYTTEFYGNVGHQKIYAASGLFYNFENIVFNTNAHWAINNQMGGYTKIVNSGIEVIAGDTTTGAGLFKITSESGTISVRSVNLKDIKNITTDSSDAITKTNDKRIGLFNLKDYTIDVHNVGDYWLASPNDGDDIRSASSCFL